MTINYIGPVEFESDVLEIYDKIASNYNRQNPTIIVGWPAPLDKNEPFHPKFSSQEELNTFVDNKIVELTHTRKELLEPNSNFYELKEREKKILDDLGVTTSELYNKSSILYHIVDDVIYTDQYAFSVYLYCRLPGGPNEIHPDIDMELLSNHEMVHFDVGECTPKVNLRNYKRELTSFQVLCAGIKYAAAAGEKEFADWFNSAESKELQKRVIEFQGVFNGQSLQKEVQRLKDLDYKEKQLHEDLHIDIGNEAAAYAIVNDEKTFEKYLRQEQLSTQVFFNGKRLFNLLRGHIEEHNTKSMIREIKDTINEAYDKRRNLFEVFLERRR